jgi:flagellar motor switch protein FliN/FliY
MKADSLVVSFSLALCTAQAGAAGNSQRPLGHRSNKGLDATFSMSISPDSISNFDILMDVPVQVTVELGSCHLPMRDVLQLNNGSVVQLDKVADAPVELFVNRKLVARGEVVVVDNRFGIKITELIGSVGAK